jgi:hypothetical protein
MNGLEILFRLPLIAALRPLKLRSLNIDSSTGESDEVRIVPTPSPTRSSTDHTGSMQHDLSRVTPFTLSWSELQQLLHNEVAGHANDSPLPCSTLGMQEQRLPPTMTGSPQNLSSHPPMR